MDPILEAKKSVLRTLIGDMRKKMVAMGDTADAAPSDAEEPDPEAPAEDDATPEPVKGAPSLPAATITLAAIKKGTAARTPKGPSPFAPKGEDKPTKKRG